MSMGLAWTTVARYAMGSAMGLPWYFNDNSMAQWHSHDNFLAPWPFLSLLPLQYHTILVPTTSKFATRSHEAHRTGPVSHPGVS